MKTLTTFKKMNALSLATIAAVMVAVAGQVSAIPYSGETTPALPAPAFNAYTGTPSAGDEPDFLRGKVSTEANASYRDPLNDACAVGTKMTLRVYVHNGASQYANDNGNGPSVAHGTKVKVTLPTGEASTFKPTASISANNAATVNDDMTINCNGKKVTLSYIAGSASQWTYPAGDQALSDSIITSGAPIGTMSPNGDVWGCWDQRVWVTLKVEIKEVTPPAPVYSCDLLTVIKESDRTYRFTVKYTAKGGAVLKDYTYDFGDGSTPVTTGQNPQTYTYKKDGAFTTKVTVNVLVDGKVVTANSAACAVPLTVTPKNCPVPGKGNLPENSPECKETPVAPLPVTGSGSTIGLFAAVAALAGGIHYIVRRRSSL